MPSEASSAMALGVLVAVAIAIVVWKLAAALRRASRGRDARVRARRALVGEHRAAALLEAAGFEVVGAQVPARYALDVDGAPRSFSVRADYLVERAGERFVAEVKTGAQAPRIELPATRRQLLEYGVAFDVARVLLVDVEANAIHEIALPWPTRAARRASEGVVDDARVGAMGLAFVFVGCALVGTLVAFLR